MTRRRNRNETRSRRAPQGKQRTPAEILRWHGLFAWCFYYTLLLTEVLPTRLWLRLGRVFPFKHYAVLVGTPKLMPWWQDLGVVLTGIMTIVAVRLTSTGFHRAAALVAVVVLLDAVAYHARVMWTDDLHPDTPWSHLRIFSHRRVFFQAVLSFAQSVFLFGVLYASGSVAKPYAASFTIATTLSAPESLHAVDWLVRCQVVTSLIFLVVVLGVASSAGFTRRQIAPVEED